ncbi:unnamed protein product, partial [Mesorhabditis belari]|uniref:Transportin-3 n=1 Tax=Mesorhabditis belari TaxID=2138241 RepID=A0AAF3EV86_9BILA
MMFALMAEAAQKNAPWEETEAALFIASNVIQNLLPEEDSIVPELISQLVQLAPQTAHPALILTAIQFMGGCSEWLGKHPPIQDPVMQWLLIYVVNPIYASHASESIEKICSQASIVRFIPPLSAAIERLEATTTNGKCVEKACQDITKALAMLCNSLSRQELGEQLKKICEPILMRLTMSIDASTAQVAHDENKGDAWMQMAHKPLIWIDRIASVFREIKPLEKVNYDLNQAQPWLPVAQHTLQISSQILTKYEADGRIIEHTCRAIRHVIRSLGMQSASFVPALATQLMTIYQHYQHSCILYLASIIVDEYGALPELQDGLIQMLQMLAISTFPILQKAHGFRNNPDTVDDLFRLAHRYITRCPSVFFVHPICDKLLDCALHGLHVDHGEANRSVTKYTTEMINQLISARRHNYMDDGVKAAQQLVNSYADRLTEHALKAALFDVSSYLRRELTDVICSLGKYDRELQARALIHAISTLPRGPLCATEEQLKQFHDQVCKDGTDTRNVVGYVRELVKLYE